ncbi:MAG: von Willebrand factor type A domain-containing protein [Oscillospiraceae bacterium]|nr:von Willebrand factor type A domain-containing protein [Oscillospiraceae bacterium]
MDTASYANLRRLITGGYSIPDDAVRIEEMLNYFDYDYVVPKNNAFKINTELSDCPWNNEAQLLMVGIQGKKVEKTPNSNLVFLIDTSGSMYSQDKLPLVIKSVKKLANTMGKNDRISIVTYSGEERVIVAGANGNQIKMISDLVSQLYADGVTNGESGINAAYALAEKYYIKGGNNRIIMATDGDLNVGISSEDELKKLIEEKRKSGVYFSVLGYGTGNIKDNKMETLADNGNGSYHYIDTAREAEKVLVAERDSTLFTIAEDVKLQVEFNPANVKSYRLIGYDNRRLANEDFKNDAKDAGEVGAGHSVTAIYEIIPADGKSGDSLKYQQNSKAANTDEIATVKVRYKNPTSKKVSQISAVVDKASYSKEMSDNMKLAAAVTEFGLVLKNSDHKGSATADGALKLAESISKPNYYEKELIKLIKKYKAEP